MLIWLILSLLRLALEREVGRLWKLGDGEEESDVGFAFILDEVEGWSSYSARLIGFSCGRAAIMQE